MVQKIKTPQFIRDLFADDDDHIEIDDNFTPLTITPPPRSPSSLSRSSSSSKSAESEDADNIFNEYGVDILERFGNSEHEHRCKPTYMNRQRDITHTMRSTLINWLIEVGDQYDVESETIHLTVSYLDRFMSIMSVGRSKLQLVGIAALFIAAKYEEVSPLDIHELVVVSGNAVILPQIIKMEQLMLQVLKFNLCVPTAYAFLSTYHTAVKSSNEVKYLSQYIAEASLLEGARYLMYLPSEIAAASMALARLHLSEPIWSKQLEGITGYSVQSLRTLILLLAETHGAAGTTIYKTVFEKYSHRLYMAVAKWPLVEIDDDILAKAIHLINVVGHMDADNLRKIMSKLIFE